MQASDPRVQQWIDTLLDRSREQLRAELDVLVRQLDEAAGTDREAAALSARAEAESAAAAVASGAIAAERAAAAETQAAVLAEAEAAFRTREQASLDALRAELERARSSAVEDVESRAERDLASAVVAWRASERQSEMAISSALADGIRALDDAKSLSDTLNALVAAAASHANRVAVLVVREGGLRGWGWRGFDGDATAVTLAPSAPGLVSTALRTATPQASADASSEDAPFRPATAGRAAVAVPLAVDGHVVGVLYADDDGPEPRTVPSAWPELLEVLARHASRCLESVTARRIPDLVRASAAERAKAQVGRQEEAAAERCARLLVAEIKLYHERALDEARREHAILRKLRPQIERAERLYAERVPDGVRARTAYFEQELVRTLAGGDASLLGTT
jgi:uncharacterized protein YbjQ (UPF0145 family)/putative methionine-R-sulfoxide reductase with GAF domain